MSARSFLAACLLPWLLQSCCTTIPASDLSPPELALRLFDSEHSVWYRLDDPDAFLSIFETPEEEFGVQFWVHDAGGIESMQLEVFGGTVRYVDDTPVLAHRHIDAFDVLDFDGNPECAKETINTGAYLRFSGRPGALSVRLRASNFAGASVPTKTSETPAVQVNSR